MLSNHEKQELMGLIGKVRDLEKANAETQKYNKILQAIIDQSRNSLPGLRIDGKLIIDHTDIEALLVRKNSDGGDVLVVDTANEDVKINKLKFVDGGSTVDIVRDEDDMTSDDAAALATQQSIKKYVDDNSGGLTASSGGTKTISSGTATLDSDYRRFVIAAETGTYDQLDTLSGMDSGDLVFLIADAGDVILVTDAGNISLPKDHNCILADDQYTIFYYDGTNYLVVGREISAQETTTKTINLDNSMSATDINNIIQATEHYIPPGQILTFQFADGTYTLDATLVFGGFHGGGTLYIYGNTSESGLHTDQAVILSYVAASANGLEGSNNYVRTVVRNLRIDIDSNTGCGGVLLRYGSAVDVRGCYIKGNGFAAGASYGISTRYNGVGYVRDNYVENLEYGFEASYGGVLNSVNNDETGTDPKYGLWSRGAGIKKSGTQPTGSTANELTADGGVIE